MGLISIYFCDCCGKECSKEDLYLNLDIPVLKDEDYPWDYTLNDRLIYEKRDLCYKCFDRFLKPLTIKTIFKGVNDGMD